MRTLVDITRFAEISRLQGKCLLISNLPGKALRMLVDIVKVNKGAKIRNRYNQVPHLTQDTYGKVTNSQLDTTDESQEVSPFPAGDHKAHINRRAQRHSRHKTEQKHKRSTKEVPPWFWLVGFVALRPKSTAMVIAGRSVHLTTLFPGQA